MKIGINTVLWFWPFDTEKIKILEKIKEIGFETVEFALVNRAKDNVCKIRDELDRLGLNCVLDGVVGGDKDILSPDAGIREAGARYLVDCLDLCSMLGSKYLVGPTYSVGIKKYLFEPRVREESLKRCVEIYQKISEIARDKKIKVAIEPLNRYESNFLNTMAQVKDLVDEINEPNIGIHLDTCHMNIEEKDFYLPVKIAGEKLFHIHAPENDRGTPGSGLVDWKGLARGLKEIKYQHNVDMEIAHPHVENIREPGAIWRVYDFEPDLMAVKGFKYLKTILR